MYPCRCVERKNNCDECAVLQRQDSQGATTVTTMKGLRAGKNPQIPKARLRQMEEYNIAALPNIELDEDNEARQEGSLEINRDANELCGELEEDEGMLPLQLQSLRRLVPELRLLTRP